MKNKALFFFIAVGFYKTIDAIKPPQLKNKKNQHSFNSDNYINSIIEPLLEKFLTEKINNLLESGFLAKAARAEIEEVEKEHKEDPNASWYDDFFHHKAIQDLLNTPEVQGIMEEALSWIGEHIGSEIIAILGAKILKEKIASLTQKKLEEAVKPIGEIDSKKLDKISNKDEEGEYGNVEGE